MNLECEKKTQFIMQESNVRIQMEWLVIKFRRLMKNSSFFVMLWSIHSVAEGLVVKLSEGWHR